MRVNILESYIIEGKIDFEVLKDFLGDDYYDKYLSIKIRLVTMSTKISINL